MSFARSCFLSGRNSARSTVLIVTCQMHFCFFSLKFMSFAFVFQSFNLNVFLFIRKFFPVSFIFFLYFFLPSILAHPYLCFVCFHSSMSFPLFLYVHFRLHCLFVPFISFFFHDLHFYLWHLKGLIWHAHQYCPPLTWNIVGIGILDAGPTITSSLTSYSACTCRRLLVIVLITGLILFHFRYSCLPVFPRSYLRRCISAASLDMINVYRTKWHHWKMVLDCDMY